VAGFVAYFDADHAEAAFAEGAGLGALDLYLDSCGLSRLEITQLPDPQIAVASRNVEEEVADGADAGFGCRFGRFRTDPFQGTEALLQDARAWPVNGGVEQVAAL